ncbi:hypothetical protein ACWGTO_03190 [Mesorhizobium sp. PL10]
MDIIASLSFRCRDRKGSASKRKARDHCIGRKIEFDFPKSSMQQIQSFRASFVRPIGRTALYWTTQLFAEGKKEPPWWRGNHGGLLLETMRQPGEGG